ncbi:MAG: hypothetical protein KDC54_11010 [Lewinella sp.]|nr:hypothetical protein [Lewinella sp.]
MRPPTQTSDQQLLERIRTILLRKDRQELEALRQILDDREELAQRIDPIIEAHLDELRQHFPDSYYRVIDKIIDQKLKASQDELINIIYPKLGKLIKSYINNEFRKLRERLDQQMRSSPLIFWRRDKKRLGDEMIAQLDASRIEEVYVVSHESGLLLGSASASATVDKDMIAGMLTAIKAFVEDAFQRTDEDLRAIQYGSYEILIHNFYNYYIALAIAGTLSESENDQLTTRLLDFADKELNRDLREPEPAFYHYLQKQLYSYFIQPYQKPPVT